MNAEGPERHDGQDAACIGLDRGMYIHHVPDEPAVHFQHQIELRHKVRPIAERLQDKMFQATGAIDVPKRLARKQLRRRVVGRGFAPDDAHILRHMLPSLQPGIATAHRQPRFPVSYHFGGQSAIRAFSAPRLRLCPHPDKMI